MAEEEKIETEIAPETEEPAIEENPTEEKDVETETPTPQTQDDVTEVLQTKGFDYAELQKEYLETGEISADTRGKLEAVGITGELVDNYIEGQKAKAEQERNEIAECVGGRENFDNIVQWAAQNLSESEIKSINKVTDKEIVQIILKDLQKRMEEKEGIIPSYTSGEGGKPLGDIYRSQAEMFEAIANPKYRKDEAYRADVQKKITASREAGVDLGI